MNDDWAVKMAARLRRLASNPPSGQTLRPHVESVVRRVAGGRSGRVSVQTAGQRVTVHASGPVAPAVRAELRRSYPDIARATIADIEKQVHS